MTLMQGKKKYNPGVVSLQTVGKAKSNSACETYLLLDKQSPNHGYATTKEKTKQVLYKGCPYNHSHAIYYD